MPPESRISLPWLLSTRPLLFSTPVSTLKLSNSHTRSSTAPQNLRFGLHIPSGLVSLPPVFGSLPTNVVTRPTPSPSSSTTPSVGSSTPGMYLHRSFSPHQVALIFRQSRSSIPFLAYYTWQTPRFHRSFDSGSSLRSQDSLLPPSPSLRSCPRGSSGCFDQPEGHE